MRINKMRMLGYALIILMGILSAAPSFLPSSYISKLPAWYENNQINLGLDLKGGAHLLLEIKEDELIYEKLESIVDLSAEYLSLSSKNIGTSEVSGQSVRIILNSSNHQTVKDAILKAAGDLGYVGGISFSELDGVIEWSFSTAQTNKFIDSAVEISLDVIRHRLSETGLVSPSVTKQGSHHVVVQLPGVDDPARVVKLLGTTAKMSFHWLAEPDYQGDVNILPGLQPSEQYRVQDRVSLEGRHVSDANMAYDPDTQAPVVNFKLDGPGGKLFGTLTKNNIGQRFAIVLDNKVLTAPIIQSAILGGSGQISGNFTSEEASDLAVLLRAGALPASFDVVEERTIGPSLGSDSIERGIYSGIAGTLLLFAFMFACYGRWGLIACAGLTINTILIFGVLSLFGATLTLPGIAGLILCLGMAVDANILINERIKEELGRATKPHDAIRIGFDRAYKTILDSSVTTFIAVSLLYIFGSGPLRGFALTMGVGLITSLFTSVSLNKSFMLYWTGRFKFSVSSLGGALGRLLPGLGRFRNYMRYGRFSILTFVCISIVTLLAVAFFGVNKGLDFAGGGLVEVVTSLDVPQLREVVSGVINQPFSVQSMDGGKSALISVAQSSANSLPMLALLDTIKTTLIGVDSSLIISRVEMVSSGVSLEFADQSAVALLVAAFGVLAYLWFRFERHFACAAISSVGIDIILTLGFFTVVNLEFNLGSVAALLALLGYSVNDKVVLFDRVRELILDDEAMELKLLFNQSISAVLTRTVWTSTSTILILVPMAIYGGATLQNFILPIIFGVFVGTLSTIFFAATLLYILCVRRENRGREQLRKPDDALINALP